MLNKSARNRNKTVMKRLRIEVCWASGDDENIASIAAGLENVIRNAVFNCEYLVSSLEFFRKFVCRRFLCRDSVKVKPIE